MFKLLIAASYSYLGTQVPKYEEIKNGRNNKGDNSGATTKS